MFNIKSTLRAIITSLLLLFLFSLNTLAAIDYPSPTNLKYINDYTNTLSNNEKNYIVAMGRELESKTTAQAVVVVINTLNDTPIESYANGLFRTWGIGSKDKDNGLLILVALRDKKWRVEVGRGLEGAVPDVLTNEVMTSVALPYFKNNNYGEGIIKSYSTFCDYIAKEYNVKLDKSLNLQTSNTRNQNNSGFGISGIFIIAIVMLDIVFNRGRVIRFIFQVLLFNSFFRGGGGRSGGGFGGGDSGGFGGGSSNGGGSSGSW